MMKKWIAVIMIAALTCTLFACTTSDEGSSSSQMESSSSVSESSSEVESSSSEAEPTTPTDESGEDATSTDPSSTTPTVDNTNAGQGAIHPNGRELYFPRWRVQAHLWESRHVRCDQRSYEFIQ